MFYEKEFYQLLNEVSSKINHKYKSYSILGTPLMESDFLIIGNNWGGEETIQAQTKMPLINDILADYGSSTYAGYMNFFTSIFEGDKFRMVSFLNRCVYTNACFIRTPNQGSKYSEHLKYGYECTFPFLEKIISIVKPKIIICFGNGNNPTCTNSVANLLDYKKDEYWKDEKVKRIALYRMNAYVMDEKTNPLQIKVFSFPHASRYGIWSKAINWMGESFESLKNEILKFEGNKSV